MNGEYNSVFVLHTQKRVTGWKERVSGYDCEVVEPPPIPFQTECPICFLVLRDPHQAICCGYNFCHSCSKEVQTVNNGCPTCRNDNFEVSSNSDLKHSMNQLQVLCTQSKDICKWRGELRELEHHLNEVVHPGESF